MMKFGFIQSLLQMIMELVQKLKPRGREDTFYTLPTNWVKYNSPIYSTK
jgi:hypothetical protein